MPTTRIVSCKLNLQHPYDSRTQHEKYCRIIRADLDGTIFPYDFSMPLAYVLSTVRIVSSKSDVQHLYDSCIQQENCRRKFKASFKLKY